MVSDVVDEVILVVLSGARDWESTVRSSQDIIFQKADHNRTIITVRYAQDRYLTHATVLPLPPTLVAYRPD